MQQKSAVFMLNALETISRSNFKKFYLVYIHLSSISSESRIKESKNQEAHGSSLGGEEVWDSW